jgi:hypothetical protein
MSVQGTARAANGDKMALDQGALTICVQQQKTNNYIELK